MNSNNQEQDKIKFSNLQAERSKLLSEIHQPDELPKSEILKTNKKVQSNNTISQSNDVKNMQDNKNNSGNSLQPPNLLMNLKELNNSQSINNSIHHFSTTPKHSRPLSQTLPVGTKDMSQFIMQRSKNTQSIPLLHPSSSVIQINNNSNYFINENVNLYISMLPNDISKPERLLVELIKKVLVYSSKIESLKERLCLQNPEFNPSILFNSLLPNDRGQLSFNNFAYLMRSIETGLKEPRILKILNYLTNYRYDPWEFGSRPLDSNKSDNGQDFTNLDVNIEIHEFMNMFQNVSNFLYDEMEETSGNLVLAHRDVYILRKIVLLIDLKLKEIRKIAKQLRKYNPNKLFDYFKQFESKFLNNFTGSYKSLNSKVFTSFFSCKERNFEII